MLLDEPNTFLDLRHQVELLALLQARPRAEIGVLMASHDLNLAGAFADRLMLLDQGAVAASGPPGEVLRPDILGRVLGWRCDASTPGQRRRFPGRRKAESPQRVAPPLSEIRITKPEI